MSLGKKFTATIIFTVFLLISLLLFFDDLGSFSPMKVHELVYKELKRYERLLQIKRYYDSQLHTVKLFGNFDIGYYYVNLFIGNPPQKQTVIVDTGSSITALPCSGCSNCGNHIDPHFQKENSDSFNIISCKDKIGNYQCNNCDFENRCQFSIAYQEGSSLEGYLVSDNVVLGDELQQYYESRGNKIEDENLKQFMNNQKVNFTFGCTTRETNLFYSQQADGILGLGVSTNGLKISNFNYMFLVSSILPSLIDFTFQQHNEIDEGLAFSLCFAYEGGYMTIGGYNRNKHLTNSTTFVIPYNPRSGQYVINIHAAKIGDIELPLTLSDFSEGQGSFLDSGTTMFYAHPKIYKAIMDNFNQFCNKDPYNHCKGRRINTCFEEDRSNMKEFFESFPPLFFQLDENITYTWSPEDYLFKDGDKYCLPFNEINSRVILGGIFMRHYDILFDRQNKNIHFTRSNCTENYEGPYYSAGTTFQSYQQNNNKNINNINESNKNNNDTKIILGAFVGSAILIALLAFLFYLWRRKNLNKNKVLENIIQHQGYNGHVVEDNI